MKSPDASSTIDPHSSLARTCGLILIVIAAIEAVLAICLLLWAIANYFAYTIGYRFDFNSATNFLLGFGVLVPPLLGVIVTFAGAALRRRRLFQIGAILCLAGVLIKGVLGPPDKLQMTFQIRFFEMFAIAAAVAGIGIGLIRQQAIRQIGIMACAAGLLFEASNLGLFDLLFDPLDYSRRLSAHFGASPSYLVLNRDLGNSFLLDVLSAVAFAVGLVGCSALPRNQTPQWELDLVAAERPASDPLHRAHGLDRMTTASRIVGLLLVTHGVTLIVLFLSNTSILRVLFSGDWRYTWANVLDYWFWMELPGGPLALGCATVAAGVGLALRRNWGRQLAVVICIAGLLIAPISLDNCRGACWQSLTFMSMSPVYYGIYVAIFVVGLVYALLPLRPDAVPTATVDVDDSRPPSLAVIQSEISKDANWREALLKSLRATGVHRQSYGFSDLAAQLFIILISALGLGLLFALLQELIRTLLRRSQSELDVYIFAGIAFALFSGVVAAHLTNGLVRSYRQLKARSAVRELERDSSRRPIFYLRSFNLDKEMSRPSAGELLLGRPPAKTAEQRMVKILARRGPVIAIGQPQEQLPALGAARFYVGNDLWQQKVADVASVSQLVVWATGVTEGLRWEILHLLGAVPLDRLIVWAHPHLLGLEEPEREAEWQRFLTKFDNVFPQRMPQRLGQVRFFHFDPNGELLPVAPSRQIWDWLLHPWRGSQDLALRVVLKAKRVPPST